MFMVETNKDSVILFVGKRICVIRRKSHGEVSNRFYGRNRGKVSDAASVQGENKIILWQC